MQIFGGRVLISRSQCNQPRMVEELGVLNADRQRGFDGLLGVGVTSIDVQGPGIGVERVHIVTARTLQLRDSECLGGLVRVIRIVED